MKHITTIASEIGIEQDHLKLFGKWKAKVTIESIQRAEKGKLILVTAMTPTSAGEGKTVTAIGLSMALNRFGRSSIVCLRQPSLGPVFGVKGGAAGGGKSTVEPMQEINLRFTGDIDAVSASHNLLSAMLDNHIFHGNDLGIDPHTISWKRAMDMNERALRHIVIGLGGKNDGIPREDGFIITAASEVMAILCIAKDYSDLKERLGRIVVGYSRDYSKAIRAFDLKAPGAMAALLKDAMEPNLVQTIEGTPALIHGGPFGNLAMGTCSLTSIKFALGHSEYAVVESGFATDLGAEKFFDVVSRVGGFEVDAVVIVASVRAIEYHGSSNNMDSSNAEPKLKRLERGLDNLAKHIENIRIFGIEPVVAINRFLGDSSEEIMVVEDFCKRNDVPFAISNCFSEGSAGSLELSERAIEACERPHLNKPLYSFEEGIQVKLERLVTQVYGGKSAEYEPESMRDLRRIETFGFANLPLCVAKTQMSLSDDPKKIGRPTGFTPIVRRFEVSAGAGFVIVDMGDIIAMPGLPSRPASEGIDIDKNGIITGLY